MPSVWLLHMRLRLRLLSSDPATFLTKATMMKSRSFGQNAELKRRLHMHDSTTGAATSKRVTWKPNSLQAMSSEAPAFAEPKDILSLRKQNCQKHIFDWLGFYSFVLRLGREERKMLTPKALANHEKNQQEFRTTYTTPSYHHLQQDVYLALGQLHHGEQPFQPSHHGDIQLRY